MTRKIFDRDSINIMSELAFLDLIDFSASGAIWNQDQDTLEFVLPDTNWCLLVLKHPELIELYQK